MNQVQMKVYLNRLKYGVIFDVVLQAIADVNLFGIDRSLGSIEPNDPCIEYVDLSESFFDNLVKEVTYHNYLVMLTSTDYDRIISNCIDKSIYLKDKAQYEIDLCDLDLVSQKIIGPVTQYLMQLAKRVRLEIRSKSQPAYSQIDPPISSHPSLNIITVDELERKFDRLRGHLPIEKLHHESRRRKSVLKQSFILPSRCFPATLEIPTVKMQPIFPRVPLIDETGFIRQQKNLLDLDLSNLTISSEILEVNKN
jgi:hypothetical protein